MEIYKELKVRQAEEVNGFVSQHMFFAFNDKQFKEGMEKLGLSEKDTDKVYRVAGGGFCRKEKSADFHSLIDRHYKEIDDAIAEDTTGTDFIYDMVYTELCNHEYCITGDLSETLSICHITEKMLVENEHIRRAVMRACKAAENCN